MDELEFANRHLGEYKIKGSEIIPKYCPECHGGSHHDQYSFALNMDKHTYNCKRGSCGVSGAFWQLCEEFGEKADSSLEFEKKKENYEYKKTKIKNYKKPTITPLTPNEKVLDYLHLRKISDEVIKKYKVGADERGNIVFPYYDENGNHVMNKFKLSHKYIKGKDKMKSWRETDTKPVLWGMWLCDESKPLTLTEGEPDTLALATCGIENVVSVPSGSQDLTWIDICWEWLEKFKKIIIWGDKDTAGQEMVRSLINRLGVERCWIVDGNRKDANVTLYKDGKEKVLELFNAAREVPIQGLVRLADVEDIDFEKMPKIRTGIKEIDKTIGGLALGELSVWTGANASGKSTFLGQLVIEAIDQGFGVCAYSGELSSQRFRNWIELQMAGKDNLVYEYNPILERDMPKVSKQNKARMRSWYYDKLFLHDSFGSTKNTELLKVFEYAVKRYDCKMFLVDNLMTTFYDGGERDYYRQQSVFVGQLIDFANRYNVHINLVAHPRKQFGDIQKNDISGTGDITNRADNVFAMARVDKSVDKKGNPVDEFYDFDNKISILKNRMYGVQDITIPLLFDKNSKRMYRTSYEGNKEYGWLKEERKEEYKEVEEKAPWD